MSELNIHNLLEAGVHFGHLTRKWHPKMTSYIFMKKNGVHIIDLSKTILNLKKACIKIKDIVSSGKSILFVCTKKQGKDIVTSYAKKLGMPYVTERWFGGFLTNLHTIRKAIKKMNSIERKKKDGTYKSLSKKEKLLIDRSYFKLNRNLGSVSTMVNLPGAIFIIDIIKEKIAIKEAQKLNIPLFGVVDTNSDPRQVNYPIPANDDSSKSINLIMNYVSKNIKKGLNTRVSR